MPARLKIFSFLIISIGVAGCRTRLSESKDLFMLEAMIDAAATVDLSRSIDMNIEGKHCNLSLILGAEYKTAESGSPKQVVAADVNEDGHSDLLLTDLAHLQVLLGKGDGTFGSPIVYPGKVETWMLATNDFDRDGHLDVVAITNTMSAIVFQGHGDGTFQLTKVYPIGAELHGIAAGEFNGNQGVDFAVIRADGIDLFSGHGNGSFDIPVHVSMTDLGVALAADLDKDHVDEVIVGDYFGTNITVFRGVGGGLQATGRYSAVNRTPIGLAVGDLRGIGRLDLVTGTNSSPNDDSVTIFLSNGDGTFAPRVASYPAGHRPIDVVTGRFDCDTIVDVATANVFGDTVSILVGAGDGTFKSPIQIPVGIQPDALTAADFNEDGRIDLAVVVEQSMAVRVLINNSM